MVPRSSSGVLGPSVGLQFPLLSGDWKPSRSSLVLRFWVWFSSSHFWSLLHWRHLSVVRPASAGDCCLSGLWAGGFMHGYGCRLSSSPSGVVVGDISVPLMPCVSTGIFSCQSWPFLDFPCCGFSAGLCRYCFASPSRCLSEYALSSRRLVSPRCGYV